MKEPVAAVELLWIPLGAGQHVVRLSGRAFEAVMARVQHRPACDLYHSALIVNDGPDRYVVEMTPVVDAHGDRRGVVGGGAVGLAWLGRFRWFRYEIHRWLDGVIPDANDATTTTLLPLGSAEVRRLLDLVALVPTPVWGRDELGTGEMWNSNSVTSWILVSSGIDIAGLGPPVGGRAPGWEAGIALASPRCR